ncbi:hypothetical protein BHYA_0267g00020 [Botrytis hyacinthi]|uniref:t-SNARE coiled-coil homology domain-containing protein n=1 Tax=Botrytis hyacinthi TaxID=278943 RepID=A0A4Z1G898_9HELO|nr:hypothetical protein BHYA_0267g00020 [Botrytis hyacinthi]
MSDAYERERQNNSRLNELSAKVSALRGVTVDIYDNARAQDVIDNTSDTFSSMSSSLKGSASRLGRMASSGNKVAILKLSGMIIGRKNGNVSEIEGPNSVALEEGYGNEGEETEIETARKEGIVSYVWAGHWQIY